MSHVVTELRCPSCGAPDRTTADAQGMRTCPFCSARYHVNAGPHSVPPVQAAAPIPVSAFASPRFIPPQKSQAPFFAGVIFAIVAVMAIAGAIVGVAVTTRSRPSAAHVSSTRATGSATFPATEDGTGAKATATFTAHRIVTTLTTAKYVLGVAQNTSPFTIDKPEIVVVMKDAAGKELKTDHGYAERDSLAAGESSPVSILLMNPPAFASVSYEITARKATYVSPPALGLRLEALPPEVTTFGSEFKGKVFNDGNAAARFVRIEVVGFDASDKILGLGFGYAIGERLEPHTSARYDLPAIRFPSKPARFDVTVSGGVAP
jgi:hypothetical protein